MGGWSSVGEWLVAWGGDSAGAYASSFHEEGFTTLAAAATLEPEDPTL